MRSSEQQREGAAAVPSRPVPPPRSSSVPLWIRRTLIVLFVLVCVEIGMMLIVLPWTSVWAENSFFAAYPHLRMNINHGFFRGVASGFGLLTLWIGVWEAAHFRDHR